MKKREFIILFLLTSFILVYAPLSQSVTQSDPCTKYSKSSCPSTQCKLETRTIQKTGCSKSSSNQVCVTNPSAQDDQDKDCFSSNELGVVSSSKPSIQAGFIYENTKTDNWEFELIGENIRISYPTISVSSNPGSGIINTKVESKNGNCEYHSFTYQRPQQSLTYRLPAQSSIPQNVNGKPVCIYSLNPITNGENRITLLPGKSIQSLDQICPELQRGKPLQTEGSISGPQASPELSPQACPSSEECKLTTPLGPSQTFGFKVTTDNCGKKKIIPDNNGAPISQTQLLDKANQAVANCAPKTQNQPPSICPVSTTLCTAGKSGDGQACCPSGWSCRTYKEAAWCSPDKASSCKPPKSNFCTKNKGGGSLDNACCYSYQQCIKEYDYSWCKTPKSYCDSQGAGYKVCGNYCCTPDQECHGNGIAPDTCSWKSSNACPAGKEKCSGKNRGYSTTLCCNTGKCISSQNGPPTCSDNQYYP